MATTNTAIKFFKGNYGSTLASTKSTENAGGIVFDNTSHQIFVGGVAYGGAITDATFVNNRLTITKVGTDPIVLDFSDTASADAVYHVFTHMNSLIGTATEAETLTDEYANTHYLTSAGNLIAADKALDTAIYNLGTRIDNLSTSNVETVTKTVNASTGETTLTFKGVSETGGVVEVGTRTDYIVLKKVATTGNAADVAVADTAGVFVGTNVEDVLLEISSKISDSNLSINGQVGQFTTDNTMITVDANNKVLGVNTTGYIGTSTSGIDLVADKVDTAGNSTDDADLATVLTVKTYISTEIAALNVTEYAQAEIAQGGEGFSVYGIKEENGKIVKGANAFTLNLGSVYNETNNKVALVSNITDAINNLDVTSPVQAVTASDTSDVIVLTMKGVEEENGLIKQGSGIGTVTFAKVAKTGAAADVTLAAANTPYVGSNVDQTIVNVDSRLKALETLPTFDTVVSTNAATTPDGVTWGDVTGTLEASNDTMHKIYLVPASRSGQSVNTYAEYITVHNGNAYTWEKVGDTATDLTGYVQTITVNGKQYAITANTTNVALDDVITNVVADDADITSGFSGDYVDTKISVQTGTAANGVKISTVTSTSGVKVQAMNTANSSNQGLAEASDVKTYIGSRVQELNVAETPVTGTNVSFKYKETNGLVEIGTLQVDYATVTVDTTAEPSLYVQNGSRLVTGNDIASVKDYVDAKISTSINALDASVTSAETTIATVQVVEENGKITGVHVTAQDAQVSYTASVGTTTPANIQSSNTTGALTGADIETIKSYVDDKASQASQTEVTNAHAIIPVNVGTDPEVILGTVAGTAITAQASFTWEEYS